jgi:hypothetical protein
MTGVKYSYQLTDIIEGDRDEVFRAVEEKTKAKDKGKVLSIIDQHSEKEK